MATAFKRKGSRLVGKLDEGERQIVVSLLRQTRELVGVDDRPSSGDPLQDLLGSFDRDPIDPAEVADRDPALQRLLPPASRDDPQLAQDFRSMTEDTLRRRKSATLATAIGALQPTRGDRLELDLGQAQALMMGLADVRLVLGERLDLRTDEDSDLLHAELERASAIADPRLLMAAYYDFLTWLQESVALALTG